MPNHLTRKMLNIVSAMSIATILLLLLAWAFSYSYEVQISLEQSPSETARRYVTRMSCGGLALLFMPGDAAPIPDVDPIRPWRFHGDVLSIRWDKHGILWYNDAYRNHNLWFRFESLRDTYHPKARKFVYHAIVIPIWFLFVSTSLIAFLSVRPAYQCRRRARQGRCIHCGYDLRVSSGHCPECGSIIANQSNDNEELIA